LSCFPGAKDKIECENRKSKTKYTSCTFVWISRVLICQSTRLYTGSSHNRLK
jgi:hypothetical protein